jgi:hypothetical protein
MWWYIARPSDKSLARIFIAGSLAQILLISALLPSLSAFWTSQRVANELAKLGANGTIAAAGYYEPSLVFLLDGRTREVVGADAAASIEAGSTTIAIVEERELPSFVAALRSSAATERAVIDGFNYSKGKRVRLHVFQALR